MKFQTAVKIQTIRKVWSRIQIIEPKKNLKKTKPRKPNQTKKILNTSCMQYKCCSANQNDCDNKVFGHHWWMSQQIGDATYNHHSQ